MEKSKSVPSRADVAKWSVSQLADYFRKSGRNSIEKVVKKYGIDGSRFVDLSENDIQRFQPIDVPVVTKLIQEIKKKDERRGFFQKKPQVQKMPELSGYRDDEQYWSSFDEDEDDDYESPDPEDDADDADYESPTEDIQGNISDNDYEPPPSNDEEMANVICPAKPITGNSEYIDRPTSMKSPHNPPVPPQRPGPSPMPPLIGSRGGVALPLPLSNDDSSRERHGRPTKPPAPSIDRSKKPLLDRSVPNACDRDSPVLGKKSPFPDKSFTPQPPMRPHFQDRVADASPRIPKPPIPTERSSTALSSSSSSSSSSLGRKIPPGRPPWTSGRNDDEEEDDIQQRPVPQPGGPPFNSNTFPYRNAKSASKPALSGTHSMPTPDSLSPSNPMSMPHRLSQVANANRPGLGGHSDMKPPIPPSGKKPPIPAPNDDEEVLDHEWYVGQINRGEAESALRRINQDGAFLVRDSSRKTPEHPYVLVVLYNDKVYNVQIRYNAKEDAYLLGTGLRGRETFTSVTEIIEHFRKTPLLLIDGKDQDSRNQCTLTYAAATARY
ncbi:lymphocyte cytosolic protein 2 [Protopterus annectens]|uniref:lymphocyte cytosolic protein 2 n=1 Tax=Protopterus annectens TaxID=7888 RepID=UPI001CF98899|nr:lymphocyte cytosolic protein 2 [Protopterus annectens]